MKRIYLDYAAATPMSEAAVQAMKPYLSDRFYNPSATYLAARSVRNDLSELRDRAARVVGARPAEIIFTAGATEANNLALHGVAKNFPQAKILISSIEHDSVLNPARELGAVELAVNKNGVVELSVLAGLIDEQTVLVSIMLVNNELGTIQPLRDIAQLLATVRAERLANGNRLPLYLHTDAAQATNYLDLHVSRLGVDMMSINGGKIYGPKGAGLLYVKAGTKVSPLLSGGGQEFGLRSGTENLASIAALVKAFELAQAKADDESYRLHAMRHEFENELTKIADTVHINGGKHRAPHLTNATFEGHDNETLMMKLDEAGIECALGSACSASSDMPSHVLKSIGLTDEQARSTLRFSMGKSTDATDLKKVVTTIQDILAVKQ